MWSEEKVKRDGACWLRLRLPNLLVGPLMLPEETATQTGSVELFQACGNYLQ